ncbi:MAG: hypothetical protein JWM14_24 [Chitinophagaceae bacterium]|nr:hypothetical protein [Chitinophagaceae bacterium]
MKKITFLLLAVLGISYASLAQSNVSFGSPYSSVDAPYNHYFYNGNELLSVKAERQKLVLQKLNSTTLSEISSKTFTDLPKHYKIEYTVETGGKFYLLYSVSGKNNLQLFAREIDFAQGTFASEAKQIISTEGSLKKKSSVGLRSSYDQSKLLIFYSLATADKNTTVTGMHVFNASLETVWKNQFKSTSNEQQLDFAVDAAGTVYYLTEKNSSITLTTTSSAGEPSVQAISLDKKTIRKIGLFETSPEDILCAGFYNKDINTSAAGGLFILKSKHLNEAITCPISQSVMQQYTSDIQQYATQFMLKEVILEKDGGLTLIGESQRRETIHYYTPKGLARNAYFLHYDDILVTKIDAAGNLTWMRKLPKRQTGKATEGQGVMSYRYMASENNYYLIFLDNENNKSVSLDDAPVNYVNGEAGALTAYEISKDKGAVTKLSILNTNDEHHLKVSDFSTQKIIPVDTASFVLEFSKKGKEDVLMKTVFTQ